MCLRLCDNTYKTNRKPPDEGIAGYSGFKECCAFVLAAAVNSNPTTSSVPFQRKSATNLQELFGLLLSVFMSWSIAAATDFIGWILFYKWESRCQKVAERSRETGLYTSVSAPWTKKHLANADCRPWQMWQVTWLTQPSTATNPTQYTCDKCRD